MITSKKQQGHTEFLTSIHSELLLAIRNSEKNKPDTDLVLGELIIPASQRPDGTWRKARRVKDGYIPQEEVPVYESKGMQWAKSKPDYPIGLHPDDIEKLRKARDAQNQNNSSEDSMTKSAKKNAKRKEKRRQKEEENKKASILDSITKAVSEVKVTPTPEVKDSSQMSPEEKVKRIKNLKKKLRQIEELESKIASGDIKTPDKDQQEKLNKKQSFLDEIEDLELDLDD